MFFLITEDYKFFRTFVRSPTVEKLQGETTMGMLKGEKAVAVKQVCAIILTCKY